MALHSVHIFAGAVQVFGRKLTAGGQIPENIAEDILTATVFVIGIGPVPAATSGTQKSAAGLFDRLPVQPKCQKERIDRANVTRSGRNSEIGRSRPVFESSAQDVLSENRIL